MLDRKHKLHWKWGHIVSYVAHQYSRVDFYSSLEVNLSLYYGGVQRYITLWVLSVHITSYALFNQNWCILHNFGVWNTFLGSVCDIWPHSLCWDDLIRFVEIGLGQHEVVLGHVPRLVLTRTIYLLPFELISLYKQLKQCFFFFFCFVFVCLFVFMAK